MRACVWLLSFSFLAVGEGRGEIIKSLPKPAITNAQVANWTRYWQKILGLDDWKVESYIVRAYELKPETLGNLRWNSVTRQATLRVLSPVDYDNPQVDISEDMEYTVLHELLHLQLCLLPKPPNKKEEEEQAVNRLADGYMILKYGQGFARRSKPVQPYRAPVAKAMDARGKK